MQHTTGETPLAAALKESQCSKIRRGTATGQAKTQAVIHSAACVSSLCQDCLSMPRGITNRGIAHVLLLTAPETPSVTRKNAKGQPWGLVKQNC